MSAGVRPGQEGCLRRAWAARRQVTGSPWSLEGARSDWHLDIVGKSLTKAARPCTWQNHMVLLAHDWKLVSQHPLRGSTDQCELGLAVSYPSCPFRTVARFKQARGWLGAVYFRLKGLALRLYLPCEAACNLICSLGLSWSPGSRLPDSTRPP